MRFKSDNAFFKFLPENFSGEVWMLGTQICYHVIFTLGLRTTNYGKIRLKFPIVFKLENFLRLKKTLFSLISRDI